MGKTNQIDDANYYHDDSHDDDDVHGGHDDGQSDQNGDDLVVHDTNDLDDANDVHDDDDDVDDHHTHGGPFVLHGLKRQLLDDQFLLVVFVVQPLFLMSTLFLSMC